MHVFVFVDHFINYPGYTRLPYKFSERHDRYLDWYELQALDEKVVEWSKEHPMIWNVGIGPGASFGRTLTRILFEVTNDIYGSYDKIVRVRLPIQSTGAASSATAQHFLALQVLKELATTMLETPLQEDIKQLAAEESYFGYNKLSDNLMVQAFGKYYISWYASDGMSQMDPIFDREHMLSPIAIRMREALQGKQRHLLLVENLYVPISLDVLVFAMGQRRPSIPQNQRWLISTNSMDVFKKSRGASSPYQEYFYAPPFDDLRDQDWAMLIREALRDAARSICVTLKDKGDEEFWLHVAQQCLYYGILYHPVLVNQTSSVTSDELVRCWVAEDLLFSTQISTNTPAAIGKKHSNYYRSAYEAGKVLIQALQEYSLLPIYSDVSTATVRRTGVSKLAEGVPLLNQYELYNHLKRTNQLRWVSFMNGPGKHVSWDWEPRKASEDIKMTTLILRGCYNMSVIPFDKLLTPHLCVLDLSHTPINSLPHSFPNLLNLYMLSLRGCSQLQTLSPPPPNSDKETSSPLAHLKNIQVLDMNGVPLVELTQQDGSNKSNLHYLDLSGSKFTTLPSEFFCEMSSLEELILCNCTNLRELPPSMAQLLNLLVLHVEGTHITSFPEHVFQKMQSLHTLKLINNILLSLPMSLSEAKGLKELHISDCISLSLQIVWILLPFLENLYIKTWEDLEDIKILGHPNLRTFSLSGPWVRCLSLCGCSKLKSVNFKDDLTALEDVDLSGTAIEEVPHNLLNLPRLNMLLLFGVPCSMRFPWHQLVRFPKVFYLDHCVDDDNQLFNMFCQKKLCAYRNHQEREKTTNTVQINLNDPRMFHSFDKDAASNLVKKGQFLQSFNVQVQPCSVRGMKPRSNEVECSASVFSRHPTYCDVQCSAVDRIMPMMKLEPKQRHVEISAVNQYPNGLRHFLSVTNSVLITDDSFIRCVTDLNYNLNELEECQLQRCHEMTVVFLIRSLGSEALPNLQTLQVLDLSNLLCLVEPSDLSYSEFMTLKLLKHIHLEHCPRLEKMFPCSLSLPALETLVILFCSNLKTIFYKQREYKVAPSPLPNIKKIYLQELPQLQHIHDDVLFRFEAPNWEKLFLRGCQSFHHLPLLKKEYPKSKVEVSGEREWWDRLQLKLPEQSEYYLHVAPPMFVSRKKHIIESYLR